MRGYWFLVAIAASAATGCAEWPRSANLGDDPAYVDVDAEVTVPVTYQAPVADETAEFVGDSLDAWEDLPTGETAAQDGTGIGLARLFHGTLDGGGWSNEGETGCGPFPGFYEGDSDGILRLTLNQVSYLCVRGQLDSTEDVGWDLSLIRISENACDGPVTGEADKPIGSGLTQPDVVWGANLEPGEYSVLIGAYHPATAELNVGYTVGISVWAPFSGSAQQCPLLEAAE